MTGANGYLLNSVEGYIHSQMDEKTRQLIFGANKHDSALCTGSTKAGFKKGQGAYDGYCDSFFTAYPVQTSMYKMLIPPFGSQLHPDGRSIKTSVLPFYTDKNTSIKCTVDLTDNFCFHQLEDHGTTAYKLDVSSMKLLLYRIRFTNDIGYELCAQKLFSPCARENVLLPCSVYSVYTEQVQAAGDWVERRWNNCKVPQKLLIFKCNSNLINPTNKPYTSSNDDYWKEMFEQNVSVTFNGLSLYESKKNIFDQNESTMTFMNLSRLQKKWLFNFDISEKLNYTDLRSPDNLWPCLLLDFGLYGNTNKMVNPILGAENLLENTEGELKIRITFQPDKTIEAGAVVYVFFYEKYVNLRLSDGCLINPLETC